MLSVMINTMLGNWVPKDGFDTNTLDVDQFWKVIYLAPIIPSVLALFMNLCVHKQDSINFLVRQNQQIKVIQILEKLYPDATMS